MGLFKLDGHSFRHFSEMRNHKKILAVRYQFGNVIGYSFCVILMELIATEYTDDWDTRYVELISKELDVDTTVVIAMFEYIKILGVFVINKVGIYYSDIDQKNEVKTIILARAKSKYTRLSVHSPTAWNNLKKEVFERDGYTCTYCGSTSAPFECDHKHPFSKGGQDTLINLTTSCQRCNRQKRDKTVEEFFEWRKRKTETDSYEVLLT